MKKNHIILAIVVLTIVCTLTACGEAWKRQVKSFESNYGGGLDRTITVYDYNGNELRTWSGKFDISEDTDVVSFDLDGKRIVIKGGITIIEEN